MQRFFSDVTRAARRPFEEPKAAAVVGAAGLVLAILKARSEDRAKAPGRP